MRGIAPLKCSTIRRSNQLSYASTKKGRTTKGHSSSRFLALPSHGPPLRIPRGLRRMTGLCGPVFQYDDLAARCIGTAPDPLLALRTWKRVNSGASPGAAVEGCKAEPRSALRTPPARARHSRRSRNESGRRPLQPRLNPRLGRLPDPGRLRILSGLALPSHEP